MSKNISIRKRLSWYVIAATLAMLVVIGIAVYIATTDEADEIFDNKMAQTASILESFVSKESIAANRARLKNTLDLSLKSQSDGPYQYDKELFFAVRDDDGNNLLSPHLVPDLRSIKNKEGYLRLDIEGDEWVTYTRKTKQDDLWIIIGERVETRTEINEHLGNALLIPITFLLPFILFFLWKIVGVALKPLRAVVEQVHRQEITRLSKIEVEGIPQEIEPLVMAFNQLLVKLDAGYARERRFVSDVSHELRNPLAALLINVDNAIEENHDPDLGESLASMKLSISRLSHLVAQLFDLSHSENPLARQNFTKVDMAALCNHTVESRVSTAAQKNQSIKVRLLSTECCIEGIEPLLISLVSNLVDNAIKYCGDSCEIKLRLGFDSHDLILSVDDSGEGLNSDMRSKVTERFYRASGSGATGAGLGLSIVKTIADIHSATMELTRSEQGGLCVCIRFPQTNRTSDLLPIAPALDRRKFGKTDPV